MLSSLEVIRKDEFLKIRYNFEMIIEGREVNANILRTVKAHKLWLFFTMQFHSYGWFKTSLMTTLSVIIVRDKLLILIIWDRIKVLMVFYHSFDMIQITGYASNCTKNHFASICAILISLLFLSSLSCEYSEFRLLDH